MGQMVETLIGQFGYVSQSLFIIQFFRSPKLQQSLPCPTHLEGVAELAVLSGMRTQRRVVIATMAGGAAADRYERDYHGWGSSC